MSNAALASNLVSLDDYRRSRGERRSMQAPRSQTASPMNPVTPTVWVYWVPVWVW
jgi:hypothetical protein